MAESISVPAAFPESKPLYGCIHCGEPVPQAGYACEECAEEQLPPELQKREGDTVVLIRPRAYKWPKLAGEDPEERATMLRPKNQEEKNELTADRSKYVLAAAQYLEQGFNFSKSAEGGAFWGSIVRMLKEKAHEFDPKGPVATKKKK